MNRLIKGQIHRVSNDFKLISIQVVEKLEFFYLQPRFVKQFRKYLYPGAFVQFTADNKKFKMKRRLVARIITFEKILGNRYHRQFSYFDQRIVKNDILAKIKQYKYRLFLDLEMTMQRSRNDYEEIIQAGAILVNEKDEVILNFNEFIKPTNHDYVSKRTLKFLNITEEQILEGISYKEFYQFFKKIVKKYNPAIITWGSNDQIALNKSYKINRALPLFDSKHFINMQQLHKDYFNLNYELGLFNTAHIYKIECGKQSHDAYEDAVITRLIFNKFYKIAFNDIKFNFKEELLASKNNN